jgi:stage V sporulation protein S
MVAEAHVVQLPGKQLALKWGGKAGPGGGTILRILSTSPQHTVSQVRPEAAASRLEILKVSATSNPGAVAGAIAGVVRTQRTVEVQAIGAGAVNQAVKAIAISRGYVAPGGLDLICIPSFINISINGEERTGIPLVVEVR